MVEACGKLPWYAYGLAADVTTVTGLSLNFLLSKCFSIAGTLASHFGRTELFDNVVNVEEVLLVLVANLASLPCSALEL